MTFLAPWFLLGLLAAGIPLLLHLRRRRDTKRIVFSTTQFFDDHFVRSARRAKLQDLLLMLLRMLLLALLVLALSQPLLHTGNLVGMLGIGGGPRQVALVIDNSASMNVTSAKGTLLSRAKAEAQRVLDELSAAHGDRATVVLAGRRAGGATVLFDQPTSDLAQVSSAIEHIEPTDLGTDLNGAVTAAAHALGTGPHQNAGAGDREVYVFSDLQQSAFRHAAHLSAGASTSLLLVSTRPAAGTGDDVSVDAVQYGAARPMVGVPFSFRALVTNHGEQARKLAVNLVIDKQAVASQAVDIEAGQARVVRFSHRFAQAGWFGGQIELADAQDDLATDDHRYFALHVEDRVRVLAVDGAPSQVASHDELFFFRLALTVSPSRNTGHSAVQIDTIAPGQLDAKHLRDHPLVVLANVANLSPRSLEALEQYVDRGGSVFIALGDRVRAQTYNRWLGPGRLHGGLLPARLGKLIGAPAPAPAAGAAGASGAASSNQAGASGGFIATIDQTHPMLAGFDPGDLGSLGDVHFTERYQLIPRDAQTLMQGPSGDPLLVEKAFGRGRVMLFASTLDRDWTNFPLEPTYVPWLYRMVAYLSEQSVGATNFVSTGSVVSIPTATTASITSNAIRIRLPDGAMVSPRHAGNGDTLEFADTVEAGIYRAVAPAAADRTKVGFWFAANPAAAEYQQRYLDASNVRPLIAANVPLVFIADPGTLGTADITARYGYGIWNILLWLALLAALIEPWIANYLSRRSPVAPRGVSAQRDEAPPAGKASAVSIQEAVA